MSTVIKRVVVSAIGLALLIILATAYALYENRYVSSEELLEERQKHETERYRKARYAAAKTDDQKLALRFEERISERGAFNREVAQIRVSDGIDRFEAWLIAHQYFGVNFGICGVIEIPISEGTRWRVPMAYGSGARPGTIWIDASTGAVTCDTPSQVEFTEPMKPNQASEPTSGLRPPVAHF